MQPTGSVNYHVHSDTRQAFHIDAGGVTGKLISPELVATVIDVKDVRMGDAAAVGSAAAQSNVSESCPAGSARQMRRRRHL